MEHFCLKRDSEMNHCCLEKDQVLKALAANLYSNYPCLPLPGGGRVVECNVPDQHELCQSQ